MEKLEDACIGCDVQLANGGAAVRLTGSPLIRSHRAPSRRNKGLRRMEDLRVSASAPVPQMSDLHRETCAGACTL